LPITYGACRRADLELQMFNYLLMSNRNTNVQGLHVSPPFGKHVLGEDAFTVLSLFDGMSCGQMALKRAGFNITKYYACEIDKYAIQVTQKNFPNTIQLGDVTKVSAKDLSKVNLLIGGSPCQGFSFAGKQLNFEDPRSKLFFEYVRLLNEIREINPNVLFLLENVVMKKEYQDIISEHLGVQPILINSSLVSAQNRKRLYWTNIGKISQPKDKGITWGDVREHNIEWGAMYYTDKAMDWIGKHGTRKGKPLKIHADNEKMQMLEASHHKKYSSQRFFGIIDQPAQITGRRLNEFGKREDYNKNIKTTQCLEVRGGDKVNCLTTVQKDNVISVLPIGRYPDVFKELEEGKHYRYITPIECERLQTVPDNEIICIFALCLDRAKNYVNAVEQNPKLLKLALSAEKTELNEFVKLVIQNTLQSNQQTKYIAQVNVDMQIQMQTNQCTANNQKDSNIIANNAANIAMCKNQNIGADFVHPNVFINITEGRITHFGMEELHQKGKHSTNQLNGNKPLLLSGNEIMELVKDVNAGITREKDMNFTFTTLSVLNTNSLELMLATYYLFAKSAIIGFTQNTTSQKSISVQFKINDGYTSIVSDTQRYRMLGNGWTVDVISHIFNHIKKEVSSYEGASCIFA